MQIYQLDYVDDISWVIETSRETFSTNITDGMSVYLPTRQYNRLSSPVHRRRSETLHHAGS